MRKITFSLGEFYHIYNRGTDKRAIFKEKNDLLRFFQSMENFNTKDPVGSIYEQSFLKEIQKKPKKPLVNFVAYCLNPNHYHFVLEPKVEQGVEKFMHRIGTGYTKYFNAKYQRTGVLFQGKFKASHIDSNEYLLHLSAYVNLNNKVHQLGSRASKLVKSSWDEYTKAGFQGESICEKDIILEQFGSRDEYSEFARDSLPQMLERKKEEKEMQKLLID
ncbi:MAG: transposase [Candidatus Pacebacteria bacterium]|nr:transposase [Candidatus Paceibacterota bacterium]